MRFDFVSIFPEMFDDFMRVGLLGKAVAAKTIAYRAKSPRDFATDKHKTVDDTPYGGGSGMVMRPGPVVDALEWLDADPGMPAAHRVLLTPQGKPFTQAHAQALSEKPALALVCGRYEGFDERIRSYVHDEVSLGDFVLLGGEVAAMVVAEAVGRLVPGVLGNAQSAHDESHISGLLEYPQYTRPESFRDAAVPAILRSGDHGEVDKWRRAQALARTRERRPDLFAKYVLTKDEAKWLAKLDAGQW